MRMFLFGFLLGLIVCLSIGATLYHPIRGVVTTVYPEAATRNFKTLMDNQEAIYHLIETRCGTGK